MKLEDFISASRYLSLDHYTCETLTIGRRRIRTVIYPNLRSDTPKRFPRKAVADAIALMGYQDRSTGLTMRPTNVMISFNPWRNEVNITVEANIVNSRNRCIGNARRSFIHTRGGKGKHVTHHSLHITRSNQGNGFARRYLNWAKREYVKNGFKAISVYAAGGVAYNGNYTWARLGFVPKRSVYFREDAVEPILSRARRAATRGEISPRLIQRAELLLKSGKGEALVELARLGIKSKYRTKRGHIGKELVLASGSWDGRMELPKAA